MCFGYSKEPSHRDGSFEYTQHMFWLGNKKNNFQLRTLIWGPCHIDLHFLSLFLAGRSMQERIQHKTHTHNGIKMITAMEWTAAKATGHLNILLAKIKDVFFAIIIM